MSLPSACQRVLDERERLGSVRALTVGGANIEHGYTLPRAFEPDGKYTIDPEARFAGGSSVNHACRLLALGVKVDPIFPLAQSDPLSSVIVEALDEAEQTGDSHYRRKDLSLRGSGLRTPYTTVLRHGGSRAVLNEFSPELMLAFEAHVDRQLARLSTARDRPDVLVLGHVHADRPKKDRRDIGFGGAITERILTHEALRNTRRVVNFGRSQFEQGTKRWTRVLRDHVDVFQLEISEVRRFCRDAALADDTLASILAWFRERCTVVISLERFGAIGQLAGSDRAVAAWPYLIEDVVDSTGAGDAMGAGIVSSMSIDDFEDASVDDETRHDRFAEALAFGRSCGAFACTTTGGAGSCPDLETLARFERGARVHARDRDSSRVVTSHDLFLIDRAFDR